MDEQTPPLSSSVPSLPPKKKRVPLKAILAALCVVAALLFVWWWSSQPATPRPAATEEEDGLPTIAPVLDLDITSMSEVEELTRGKPLPGDTPAGTTVPPVSKDAHFRGDMDAPVVMIEYAGLLDKRAKVIHPELVKFLDANAGKVLWVFRHYPRTNNNVEYEASYVAECIARQLGKDAFWTYIDALYTQPSVTSASLYTLATSQGANAAQVKECVTEGVAFDTVLIDKQRAQVMLKLFAEPAFVFRNNATMEFRIAEGINTLAYLQGVLDEVTNLGSVSPKR